MSRKGPRVGRGPPRARAPTLNDIVRAAALVAVIGSCRSAAAPSPEATGPVSRSAAQTISEIALERQCFGCPDPYELVLKRDGSATRTVYGNARQGTTDRSFRASIDGGEFDRLAETLVKEGFFELNDEYRDPTLADGESLTTTAVRDGRPKAVLDKNRAGPANLRRVQEAIEAAGARLAWVATSS